MPRTTWSRVLTAQDNKIDAVVAENDGMAGGVVAALTAQGLQGIPVSGQDGDKAALNRVALGTQTVSVWKDARELGKTAGEVAVATRRRSRPDQDRRCQTSSQAASKGTHEVDAPGPRADPEGQPSGRHRCRLDRPGEVCAGVTAGSVPACP